MPPESFGRDRFFCPAVTLSVSATGVFGGCSGRCDRSKKVKCSTFLDEKCFSSNQNHDLAGGLPQLPTLGKNAKKKHDLGPFMWVPNDAH